MKKFLFAAILASAALGAGTARAETVTGVVTDSDSSEQRLTMVESGTGRSLAARVDQRDSLEDLKPGSRVTFETDGSSGDTLETRSLSSSGDASSSLATTSLSSTSEGTSEPFVSSVTGESGSSLSRSSDLSTSLSGDISAGSRS